MIRISNVETYGWESAIRGMRNPMNSWSASDSLFKVDGDLYEISGDLRPSPANGLHSSGGIEFDIGERDLDLMKRLRKSGSDDRKYLRQIMVSMDILAPLYWWKEMDQYKVGTVTNSCSTMHKISAKEFTYDDFSHDHLISVEHNKGTSLNTFVNVTPHSHRTNLFSPMCVLGVTIKSLNQCRKLYLETKDKTYWWQMIQLLPSSYNQRRTWTANYEVLANIYHARKNHKLDEWKEFCQVLEKMPYAKELIIGGEG